MFNKMLKLLNKNIVYIKKGFKQYKAYEFGK